MHVYEMKTGDIAVITTDIRLSRAQVDDLAARWRDAVGENGPTLMVIDGGMRFDIISLPKADGPVSAKMDRLNASIAEHTKQIGETMDALIAKLKDTTFDNTALPQGIADQMAEAKPTAEILDAIKALIAATRENGDALAAIKTKAC